MNDGRYQPAGPVYEARSPRTNALTQLRHAYFSRCAACAARYHVSFEDIVRHLWQARTIQSRINLRRIGYLEDLVHAIGCIQHISTAWCDLSEQNERMLVRQCLSHLEDSESIVFVRRYLTELRQQNTTGKKYRIDLRGFIGDRPLHLWLYERMMETLTSGVAVHRNHRSNFRPTSRFTINPAQGLADKTNAASAAFPFPVHKAIGDDLSTGLSSTFPAWDSPRELKFGNGPTPTDDLT